MKRGEHKSLQTDRVILMPGPDSEVATVNQIYRWLVEGDLPLAEIVKRLNDQPDQEIRVSNKNSADFECFRFDDLNFFYGMSERERLQRRV